MTREFRFAVAAAALVFAACAPARPTLPSGAGAPFPEAPAAYEEAVQDCRGARTVLAELGLSGRAGETRLRGRINAGIAAPANIRLEGLAPVLGRSIFVLVARGGDATLLLTREDRVVRDAPPEAIIEALTGVALTPADLLAAVAGCGISPGTPTNGRAFGDSWAAVDVGGVTTYLRRVDARWRVAGAVRDQLTLLYDGFDRRPPATIHLRAGAVADITLRVSQLEINTDIDPQAYDVVVPPDALPLTLEELRRSGPLGDKADAR
jgi:hypothetical protein